MVQIAMLVEDKTPFEYLRDGARSSLASERYSDACAAASRAVAQRPDDHEARYLLSGALLGEGRHDDALAEALRAVELVCGDVGRWSLYGWLAHVHAARGEIAAAEQDFRRGLIELGEHAHLHAALATFMAKVGGYEEEQIRFHRQRAALLEPAVFAQPPAMSASGPPCPVCDRENPRAIPAVMADFIRLRCEVPYDEPVRSNFCPHCEHVFLTPFLQPKQLARLYEDYRGPSYNRQRLTIEPIYARHAAEFEDPRSSYYSTRENFYDTFLSDMRDISGLVVDFGGSTGEFARYVFPKAEVVVVEEGYTREGGDLPALMARASVLFCAHVFEHIPQPRAVLGELTEHLKAGARVILELPLEYGTGSLASVFEGLEQRCAMGETSPIMSLQVLHEHLAHFSLRSAAMLMERSRIDVDDTYVSDVGIFAVVGTKI